MARSWRGPSFTEREGQRSRSAAAGVLRALLAGGDPRHHAAQLLADRLDLVLLALPLEPLEVLAAGAALGDPLLGERAALDLAEDRAHLGLDGVVDDAGTPGEVAVLGGVGDRV